MVLRCNEEEDKALKVYLDAQRNREAQDGADKDDVRVAMFPDGPDHLVVLETKSCGGIFAEMASKHSCPVERCGELGVRYIRVRRSTWGRLMHDVLFACHARLDVHKYDSTLRRFTVAQTGTPSDWSQLEGYIGEDVEESALAKPIVAVFEERCGVGIFALYKAANSVRVCSFEDNDSYDGLESALVQISPMECFLLEGTKNTNEALGKVVHGRNCLINTVPSKISDARTVMQKFEDKIDFSTVNRSEVERDERLSLIAGSLMSKLILEDDGERGGGERMSFRSISLSTFMRVSSSTLEGLNIFGNRSLYKLLSYTRTTGGDRLLKTWLKQPLLKAEAIKERLDMVEALVDDSVLRKTLHDEHLRKISDLDKICSKLRKKRTTLSDLYKAFLTVVELQKIFTVLKDSDTHEVFEEPILSTLATWLPKTEKFIRLVEKTIDFEAMSEGIFHVKADIDEDLAEFKEQLDNIRSKIKGDNSRDASSLGYDQKSLKLENTTQLGFYYRVTMKDEKNLRQKKNITYIDSSKAGVKFRTRSLEARNAEYLEILKKYELQQQSVVDGIIDIVSGYMPHFQILGEKVAVLDCIVSFATAALTASPIPYVKPSLNDGGRIQLKQCRHPCIEQMDGVNYIPNDAFFSDDGPKFYVITGPNMGKKRKGMSMTDRDRGPLNHLTDHNNALSFI